MSKNILNNASTHASCNASLKASTYKKMSFDADLQSLMLKAS